MTLFGDWLRSERKKRGLSQDAAADFIGVERGAYGKVERGGTIRPNNWEEYADKFGRPREEIDALITADAEASGKTSKIGATDTNLRRLRLVGRAPAGKVPVLGMAAGGEPNRLVMLNEIVDYTDTPPELEGVEGGYALYVHGTSMIPRYYPGQMVYVHPNKPNAPDRFCVVQVGRDPESPEGGYIKQYKGQDGKKLKLAQFNPKKDVEFNLDDVISVHRIVGSRDD